MKAKFIILIVQMLHSISIISYSQTSSTIKGNKIFVHTIDGKHAVYSGGMCGYTYSLCPNGKFNYDLDSGNHSIEFSTMYGDMNEYKLFFTSEINKTYEIIKGDKGIPQIIDIKAKTNVDGAVITKVNYVQQDKIDQIVHLANGNLDKTHISKLALNPEKFDVIPVIYKIDELWGPILEVMSVTWRYNGYKKGNSYKGAMKAMSFDIELSPGEHIIEYSLFSNKIDFKLEDGFTFGSYSNNIYKLKFNFVSGKVYTFKFINEKEPSSLIVTEIVE
ncbi:MAG: hypothetical protein EHM93_16600 [Bacteroidales bacterium]|nr:MAG: hypothetical protein EHM93_16600 [Bacteroidales bacterium]